jgi:hypothetical protein
VHALGELLEKTGLKRCNYLNVSGIGERESIRRFSEGMLCVMNLDLLAVQKSVKTYLQSREKKSCAGTLQSRRQLKGRRDRTGLSYSEESRPGNVIRGARFLSFKPV